MKKSLVVCVCLLIITVPVFGQAIDKAQYKAIDPFDYKLEEDKYTRTRVAHPYKSVVEFVSEIKDNNTLFYKFISLDKHTSLLLKPNSESNLKPPSPGQTVTIYYTLNKLRDTADVVLDAFEDNRNKDEKGLGVVKSSISSSNIRKADYELISPNDYSDDAFFTQEGDDDRKFYAILLFESQDGTLFQFKSLENTPVFLKKKWKVRRRYPTYTAGQKMTVYFTATKETNDHLKIDDIVVMN